MNSKSFKHNWKEERIGDRCIVGDGAHASIKRHSAGVMYLTSKNFKDGRLDLSKVDYISQKDYDKYFREDSKALSKPQAGDVLFSIIGSMGEPYLYKLSDYFGLSSSVSILRPNQAVILPEYLYYWIQGHIFQNALYGIKGGVAQSYVSLEMIRSLPLSYPNLPTQQQIIDILSAYDRLIENNTRRIKILEEIARSLYDEWFIKFRFPGHEQIKLVDSELGLIPEGWSVRKLEKLGFLGRGKSKHRPRNDPSLYGGNYPFIQTGEVKEASQSLYITSHSQTYNEIGLAQSKLWESGTLLITIAANIAETAILTYPACFPDSIIGFVADPEQVNAEFVKYSIEQVKLRMQNVSKGTAQDNLSQEKLRIFDFLVPDETTMQFFIKSTTPIFQQIKNLLLKNHNLKQTRDLLLPKLISGDIDVEKLDGMREEGAISSGKVIDIQEGVLAG